MSPIQLDKADVSGRGAKASDAAAGVKAAAETLWLASGADRAAGFLKALSHEGRLMILCHLADGEKSVGELEQLLSQRQAAVSQQLSRLRLEGLVTTRRDGKAIYYSILDPKVTRVVTLLHTLFCEDEN